MLNINKILTLSKRIAVSLLNDEKPKSLEDSNLFSQKEKDYIIKNLTDEDLIKKRLKLEHDSDRHAAWEKVRAHIEVPVRRMYWKYAAVIVLFISIGLGYNHFYSDEFIKSKALSEIKPGYQKATLVLSDGSTIDLEAHKNELISTDENARIQNTKTGLVYEPTDMVQESDIENEPKLNTLFVPNGGVYQIKLPDGTKVWLNSATSLEFPERFIGDQRLVTLNGEAYFDVVKSDKPFVVHTSAASITVLGTQFNVSSYLDDSYFSSTLVEGSVQLESNLISAKEILKPNQRAIFYNGHSEFILKPVDTDIYTSWKAGKFYFEREPLEQILTKMGRWYNVDVSFAEEILKSETFTGVAYKNKPIENLLEMICATTKVNYKITKNSKTEKYEIVLTK